MFQFTQSLAGVLTAALLVGPSSYLETPAAAHDDLVDVVSAEDGFTALVAAAAAAGLVETLKSDGPFTLFAPTDEAFAALPAGTVEALLEPRNRDRLRAILTLHVVPGTIRAADLLAAGSARTLNGEPLPIGLRVGNANVIRTDVTASNGIIHVIDQVLIPADVTTRAFPMQLIEMAISRGAPLYNMGQPAACAAVYEMTAQALLGLDANLPQRARAALTGSLSRMSAAHSPEDQAWIMRRGLDAAYAAMSSADGSH